MPRRCWLDGLVVPAEAQALVHERHRLRLVPLVHMIAANGTRAGEAQGALGRCGGDHHQRVVPAQLLELHALPLSAYTSPSRASIRRRWRRARRPAASFLCVGAVIAAKGHDVLVDALATLTGDWRCTCVGSLERDPDVRVAAARAHPRPRSRGSAAARGRGERRRTRAALPRGRPAGARLARRDLRDGHNRGARRRPARHRNRRRWRSRGAGRQTPTECGRGCWSHPAIRRRSAVRSWRGCRAPSCGGGCAGPRRAGAPR